MGDKETNQWGQGTKMGGQATNSMGGGGGGGGQETAKGGGTNIRKGIRGKR